MPTFPNIAFDPLLPESWLIVLGILALVAVTVALFGKLRSSFFRLLAMGALALALLNPQTVEEDRQALNDEVLVLVDQSESAQLGDRTDYTQAIVDQLSAQLDALGDVDVTFATVPASENGTRMTSALIENLGNLPQNRLSGVIAVTDGRIHDLPENSADLLPHNVPFHALIVGDPTARDRRIRAIVAPQYGVVGEQAEFVVRVDDPGYEGERAPIEIRLNGELKARFPAVIGDRVSIPLEIEKRGPNTIELTVQAVDDELTLANNLFVSEIAGIRDRMRVLLVTGNPHNGGRAWRNLLKSDPSVDLVHFTILTNPMVKNTNARQDELSLIEFPTRQLFQQKLDEFDLIIFDQFKRRSAPNGRGYVRPILDPVYIQNVATYVERGGALLVATGPAFATENSLYRSALAGVLPARPTGDVAQYGFQPVINEKGRRHPVTAPFFGKDDQTWGRWFRIIESNVVSGDILMEGPGEEPLLVIDRVGDGRVGMVMSDQAWLWARNLEGGGPYNEIFRRLAHWLLGEPDLSAEQLSARSDGKSIVVERRTLGDGPQKVIVQKPDGSAKTITLKQIEPGLYRGRTQSKGQGAYRLRSGDVSTVTALGSLNPKEFANLSPTQSVLKPLSESTGGLISTINPGDTLPDIRKVTENASHAGPDWLGLTAHNDFVIRASKRAQFAPGWVFFLLALVFAGLAWWREGT